MKNIEINIKQSDGTYETLYPKVNAVSSNISTEVSQQFGLENGSIDDVLKYLGKFNEYWWSEESNTASWEWDLRYSDYKKSNNFIPNPIYYSKEINIAEDASITLIAEQSTYSLSVFKENLPCYVRMRTKYNGASSYTQEYFWVTEETCVGFFKGSYGDDNDPYIDYIMREPLIQHIIAYKKQIPKTTIWKSDINSNAYSKEFYNYSYKEKKTSNTDGGDYHVWSNDNVMAYGTSIYFDEFGRPYLTQIEDVFTVKRDNSLGQRIEALSDKYFISVTSITDMTPIYFYAEFISGNPSISVNSGYWNINNKNSYIVTGELQREGNYNLYWSSPYLNLKQMTHTYIGSWIGTGLHGYNNPTVLEFDFVPKLIICNTLYWSENGWQNSFIWTINNGISTRASGRNGSVTVYNRGLKLSLVSTDDSTAQFNKLNTTYNYVAFG